MRVTMNGIINIYKEAGYTSHDVVAKMRGILKQKKIGHTGTLDPDAVGVLPVCVGNATKLCDMLTDKSKEYIATLKLGITTDTLDLSGEVLEEKEVTSTQEEIEEAIFSFLGGYMQTPPMYSALKVDGKKLYELAREGKVIERKSRQVQISKIEILEWKLPSVKFSVECSKGTYIRSLCEDIGNKLGCGGAMESLIRSRVGNFSLENAITLKELENLRDEERLEEILLPVEDVFSDLQKVQVKESYKKLLENGNPFYVNQLKEIPAVPEENQRFRIYDESQCFYGIYIFSKERNRLMPEKMFLPTER